MIAVVDHGLGNVCSLLNALDYVGHPGTLTRDEGDLLNASHILLPGVGAFGDAMKALEQYGLVETLRKAVFVQGKPLLGICLGLQLLAQSSTEHGEHAGLGWIDATVTRFLLDRESGWKVPHMGWNEVEPVYGHPVFAGLDQTARDFYFVHSFHVNCRSVRDVLATSIYGYPFTAAVARNNIVATQFHPEKSQDNGLELLTNFVRWNP